jgi:hypothetical protein
VARERQEMREEPTRSLLLLDSNADERRLISAIAARAAWSVVGAADGEQAIALLRKYGSVTILNGHIHQVIQKVEGNITFHTARGTAYPQPAPGAAPGPGPMKVPAEQLRSYLGITDVKEIKGGHTLALVNSTLS